MQRVVYFIEKFLLKSSHYYISQLILLIIFPRDDRNFEKTHLVFFHLKLLSVIPTVTNQNTSLCLKQPELRMSLIPQRISFGYENIVLCSCRLVHVLILVNRQLFSFISLAFSIIFT